jgi:hypothetical protein
MQEAASSRRRQRTVGAVVLLAIVALVLLLLRGCPREAEGPFDYFRAKAAELGSDRQRIAKWVADEVKTSGYSGNVKGALATLWNGAGSPEEKAALQSALLQAIGVVSQVAVIPLDAKIVHRGAGETTVYEGPIGDLVGDVHSIETTAPGKTRITIRTRATKVTDVDAGSEREELVCRLQRPGGEPLEIVRELWHRENQIGPVSAIAGDRHDFVVLPCRIDRFVREKEEQLLEQRGRAESPEARGYLALLDYCLRSDLALADLERDLGVRARFDLPRILMLSCAKVPDIADGVLALDLRLNRVTFEGGEASDQYLGVQVRSFVECALEHHFLSELTRQPCSSTYDVFNKLNDDYPNSYDRRLGLLRDAITALGERGTASFRARKDGPLVTVTKVGERCTITGARIDESVVQRLAQLPDAPKVGEACDGLDAAALSVELALMCTGAPPDYVLEVVELRREGDSLVVPGAHFAFRWGEGEQATEQDIEVESCDGDLGLAWRVKAGIRPARGRRLVSSKALAAATTHNPWYRTGDDSQDAATSFCVSRKVLQLLREQKPFAMAVQGRFGPDAEPGEPRPIAWQGEASANGTGVHRTRVNGKDEDLRFLRARIGDEDVAVLDDAQFPVGMADKLTEVRTRIRARLVDPAGLGIGRAEIEIGGMATVKAGPDGRFVMPPTTGNTKLVGRRDQKTFGECEVDLTAPGLAEIVVTMPRPRTEILFIDKTNAQDLAALDLSPQARRHLDRYLGAGHHIVIPNRKLEVDGIDVCAYYAHDYATGEIIGVTEDGLHGSAASYARALASLARDLAKTRGKLNPFVHVHMMRGSLVAWWGFSKERIGGLEHEEAIDKILDEMDEWEKATNLLTGLGQVPGARRAMGQLMSGAGFGIDGAGARAGFKIGFIATTMFLDHTLATR